MRINKLRLKNFKSFDDKEYIFKTQFTVFIGNNSTGKTSILNALSIVTGSFFLGIEDVPSRTIQENEIRIITIDGQPRPQKPVGVQGWWEFTAEDRSIWGFPDSQKYLVWSREVITKNTTTGSAKPIKEFAEKLLSQSRQKSGVLFPVIAFYGTGRLWAIHEKLNYLEQGEGVKMAYTNALSAKASPKEFLEWFKTLEDTVKKFEQPLDIAHLNAFKKIITSLIPDDRWQDVAFDNRENELVGIFTTEEGKKEKLSFGQLSDGFRNMVAIGGDLAYRCIQLNPHLGENAIINTPGVVLIDEIDMHLHPNWQSRVVQDLKTAFPKIQFIATTHSPFIVHSLKEEELIILDSDITKDGDPFKKSMEDVIANEMGVVEVPRSKEFLEMEKVAEEYFKLVAIGKTSEDDQRTSQLRARLNELEIKFADDPAFVASLKIERQANGL